LEADRRGSVLSRRSRFMSSCRNFEPEEELSPVFVTKKAARATSRP
jgi:hypothetical protein